MRALVEVREVEKSYGATAALRGVSLTLRPGEVHVLAGENGAGKSTLIKLLSGVERPDRGTIVVAGREVTFRKPADARAAGIATIHQELSLVPTMSVADNLVLGDDATNALAWRRPARDRERAKARLAAVGLDVDPDVELGTLPIGAQQLVEIARALAADASILILDEPTSALAEPEAEILFERVHALRAAGRGVVYVSHRMEEIYTLADRITVLRDGRVVTTREAKDLPREALVRAMVGEGTEPARSDRIAEDRAPLLEVRRVTVRSATRAERRDVDGVSFSVSRGEIVGLFGLRGSGASELLHALFGALGDRAAVDAKLVGRTYVPRSPREALDRGVALLPNDRKTAGLVLDRSVGENLVLASLRRFSRGPFVSSSTADAAARDAVRSLHVACSSIDAPVSTLSGGNQQKVLLGRSLLAAPVVLLLDEPTRGVDVGAKRDLYAKLRDVARGGVGIVVLSSEIEELAALADRVIVLARGKIVASARRDELVGADVLAAAMGG